MKVKRRYLLLLVASLLAILTSAWLLYTAAAGNTGPEFGEEISTELVHVSPLPPERAADVAYVLGGDQTSLKSKYRTAAELLKAGSVGEIWILGRPGITEYSPELRRNLTNDEWSIGELGALGVPSEKIEVVHVSGGFFGTLAEAKQVSGRARERGLKGLVLIAQLHHTRRAYLSFKKYLPITTTLYIQSSNDSLDLYERFIELMKLRVYRSWLIESPGAL